MKKNIRTIAVYAALTITAFHMTGCGAGSAPASSQESTAAVPETTAPPILVLSVGTKENLKSYDYYYEYGAPGSETISWDSSNPDANALIAILADYTGWNLTLSAPVYVSPGNFSISFSEESSIYSGAASAKPDFSISDQKELVTTILDSIVANMNEAYHEELTIYFTAADGGDILVPGTDIVISSSEPYYAPAEE